MDERITRIKNMETRLNKVTAWLDEHAAVSDSIKEDVRALDEYYSSQLWRSDFEADEAGELPVDLPRGVLSEDGIYNALGEFRERMRKKKTIIINASPRKNWNTAELLKEAQKSAESAGAETEYIDLYDLSFTGCRSCLACKLKNSRHHGCAWKDYLSPVINRILAAYSLIIGTPIYYGEPTAHFRALMERLVFCTMPYEAGTYFDGCVNAGFIYTMNAPQSYYDANLRPYLKNVEELFQMALHGKIISYAACDTLQVNDYSIYDMGYFNEEDKRNHRNEQFTTDLAECFKMGTEING